VFDKRKTKRAHAAARLKERRFPSGEDRVETTPSFRYAPARSPVACAVLGAFSSIRIGRDGRRYICRTTFPKVAGASSARRQPRQLEAPATLQRSHRNDSVVPLRAGEILVTKS